MGRYIVGWSLKWRSHNKITKQDTMGEINRGVPLGADRTINSMTLRSVSRNCEWEQKYRKKYLVSINLLTWLGIEVLFSITIRTSCKVLTDNLYLVTTSCSDKLTRLEQGPIPPRPKWLISEVRIASQEPSSTTCCCYPPFIAAKMPTTHQRDFLQKLEVLLFLVS